MQNFQSGLVAFGAENNWMGVRDLYIRNGSILQIVSLSAYCIDGITG